MAAIFEKTFVRYLQIGAVYGCSRKIIKYATTNPVVELDWNYDEKRNKVYETRPMLWSEKAYATVGHTLVSSFYFPIIMCGDILRAEASARGIPLYKQFTKEDLLQNKDVVHDIVHEILY